MLCHCFFPLGSSCKAADDLFIHIDHYLLSLPLLLLLRSPPRLGPLWSLNFCFEVTIPASKLKFQRHGSNLSCKAQILPLESQMLASMFKFQPLSFNSIFQMRHKSQTWGTSPSIKTHIKQGRIHSNPVADGWAGAVVRKPLGIQKCYGGTDRPTRQGVESHVRD